MRSGVICLGAGGHATSVLEALSLGCITVCGLLDADPEKHGTEVLGMPVLGGDELMDSLRAAGVLRFVMGLGGVGNNGARKRLFQWARGLGLEPVTVIHPRAIISQFSEVGAGSVVLAGAIVGPGAVIGENVIVNTGAIVEHDCRVDGHVHLATGSRLTGNVVVETGAHVGAGATIRQGVRIGPEAVVGAGAVVLNDAPAGCTVVGVPAHPLNHPTEKPE